MPWAEALTVGTLLALLFVHRTGWTPGGLITPGFLVLYIDQWAAAAGMICVALLTWAVVVWLQRWLPLYGRRRWGACIATAIALSTVVRLILASAPVLAMPGEWEPLGLIIPGLIANGIVIQGPGPTATGLVSVTAATWWVLIVCGVM